MATECNTYEFTKIEAYWQKFWEANETFVASKNENAQTFYVLDMFPYPSGAGLHIGHPEGYTATDILGRYKKANGYNVLHPMGWDAFGLPAEQHAITTGTHPAINTQANIDNFRRQIKALGFGLDWNREVNTTDPAYYKWTQWIFTKLFQKGLAHVDDRPVWFCPELGTVLANEEVLNTDEGPRSERGNHPVERRALRQWVLKITDYAEKLLDGLKDLDWPDSTKRMQQEWIGRSEGAEVLFALEAEGAEPLKVFTTRPDTLFGATYMVVAPEHPILDTIVSDAQVDAVNAYKQASASKSDLDRTDLAKGKSGVFTGAYAINPVSGEKLPIWVADYVLMSYGTGAIMAVPAHDERDYEFAQTYDLPIIEVVQPKDTKEDGQHCYSGKGTMIHSGTFDGLDSDTAKDKIIAELESAQKGKRTINYKLRDWLFSRQRYWGEPFPILWIKESDYTRLKELGTESCFHANLPEAPVSYLDDGTCYTAIALPDKQLPLELPEVESYQPSKDGQSPLANAQEWSQIYLNIKTGATQAQSKGQPEGDEWVVAHRETNTMPQWAGSCWYYLRFLDPQNSEQLIDPEIEAYWGMPDIYIGGAEHAVLHLLYARFWHLFLYDIGVLKNKEPFKKLFHQGIILGEDGSKMSKSKGNVVNPDEIIESYGTDALRMFEMFLGPLEAKKPWNEGGIEGIVRFLRKAWREVISEDGKIRSKITQDEEDAETERLLHQTIQKVTEDIENLRLNTAISQLMIMLNRISKANTVHIDTIKTFLQLLAPLAPHICEELWERIGEKPSISNAPWPQFDPSKLVSNEVKIIFQVNGKVRGECLLDKDTPKEAVIEAAKQHERVSSFLEGKQIVKEIYVPGKIVNLVAK